jgi:predicted NBD/HSP70 family sugar kinase
MLASRPAGASDGEAVPASGSLRASQRRVLRALTWSGGLTRTALAAELAMPKATVTGLVDSLIARGLVDEKPALAAKGRAGRPAKLLSTTGPSPTAGALLIQGKTLLAAVVTYSGQVLSRTSAPIVGSDPNADTIRQGVDLLLSAIEDAPHGSGPSSQPSAVVLGIPAPFLPKVGLPPPTAVRAVRRAGEPLGYMGWLTEDVITDLEKKLGIPAIIENDANLGALGEATFGAGQGVDSFIFLKLSRGVGAGLVFGGRLHRGATGFAGELGHVHVRDDGPLCACGGRGCLHDLLGDALVQAVQPAYDRPLTLRDVLELAAGGEPGPRRVLGDLGRTLGRPLADFATLLNPGAIIVDGSFAPAVDHVVAGIRETVDRYAAPVAAEAVSVIAGTLGEEAELQGAAVLARWRHSEAGPGGSR